MSWTYMALTPQGLTQRGHVSAITRQEAYKTLEEQGLLILSVQQTSWLTRLLHKRGKVPQKKDLVRVFRQAFYLSQSGLNTPQWLQSILEHETHPSLCEALRQIRHHILQGTPLSKTLHLLGPHADEVIQGLIRQGEQQGSMTQPLQSVVDYLSWQLDLRQKWGAAIRYPILLLISLIAVLLVFSLLLVPEWEKLFQSLKLPLEGWSWWVLHALKLFPWVLILSGIGVGALQGYAWYQRQPMITLLARLFPFLRSLQRHKALCDWFQAMWMNLQNNHPLLTSVSLSAHVMPFWGQQDMQTLEHTLKQGLSLSASLGRLSLFPKATVTLIHSAEQSGHLIPCFAALKNMYHQDLEHTLQRHLRLLEPVMLGILGCILVTLVVGLVYPLYQQNSYGGLS